MALPTCLGFSKGKLHVSTIFQLNNLSFKNYKEHCQKLSIRRSEFCVSKNTAHACPVLAMTQRSHQELPEYQTSMSYLWWDQNTKTCFILLIFSRSVNLLVPWHKTTPVEDLRAFFHSQICIGHKRLPCQKDRNSPDLCGMNRPVSWEVTNKGVKSS